MSKNERICVLCTKEEKKRWQYLAEIEFGMTLSELIRELLDQSENSLFSTKKWIKKLEQELSATIQLRLSEVVKNGKFRRD